MRQARIFTPDNLLLIRQMAAEGKSSIEIAESIASTPASVRVVCCHHNIKLTRGRAPSNHAIVTGLSAPLLIKFRRKAEDLRIPASILARRLLTAIVVSNIYEAVLDDNS